jgi:hypothetical protein
MNKRSDEFWSYSLSQILQFAPGLEEFGPAAYEKAVESGEEADELDEQDDSEAYEKYWQNYAPNQREPGQTRFDFKRISGRTGREEESRVIYDDYGRQIYRIDKTDHMRPDAHTDPHLHVTEYGPAYSNEGKQTLYNLKP